MSHPIFKRILDQFSGPPLHPVTCPTHGSRPRCYTVCLCILKAFKPVAHFRRATNSTIGIVHCERTNHRTDRDGAVEWALMCDLCVERLHRLDVKGACIAGYRTVQARPE